MKKRAWPFRIAVFSGVQFIALTGVSMLLFAGGSMADSTLRSFSFQQNFLSELGMTVTNGAQPNLPGAVFFMVALSILGIGLAIFYHAVGRLLRPSEALRIVRIIISILASAGGLCCVGMAVTPPNLAICAHMGFLFIALPCLAVAMLLHALSIFLSDSYPKAFAVAHVAIAVLFAGHLAVVLFGPGLHTTRGVIIQATGQKVAVYPAIANFIVETIVVLWGLQETP
jgi:hypothetical protein